MEDREKVVGNVRDHHSRTRVLSDFQTGHSRGTLRSNRGQHEARLLRQHHSSRIMRYDRNLYRRMGVFQAPRVDMPGWRVSPARHVRCRLSHVLCAGVRQVLLPGRYQKTWRDARGSVSIRGFARRSLIPGLRCKCTHARSGGTVGSIISIGSTEVASALRGAGIDAFGLMPRSCVVLAGHGWGYEHGCSD